MKKVAVILSGCGVYDGTEIHEAVLTLLALDQAGAAVQCFAPNIAQYHVINHLTGEVSSAETRNVLVESARIARGNVQPLQSFDAKSFDAVILPGGFGAAKNLSDFAVAGADLQIEPSLAAALHAAHAEEKPIGFICISPVIAAKIFGPIGPKLTIGNDPAVAHTVNTLGAQHQDCPAGNICADTHCKIFSTPAYMLGASLKDIAPGISQLVQAVLAAA